MPFIAPPVPFPMFAGGDKATKEQYDVYLNLLKDAAAKANNPVHASAQTANVLTSGLMGNAIWNLQNPFNPVAAFDGYRSMFNYTPSQSLSGIRTDQPNINRNIPDAVPGIDLAQFRRDSDRTNLTDVTNSPFNVNPDQNIFNRLLSQTGTPGTSFTNPFGDLLSKLNNPAGTANLRDVNGIQSSLFDSLGVSFGAPQQSIEGLSQALQQAFNQLGQGNQASGLNNQIASPSLAGVNVPQVNQQDILSKVGNVFNVDRINTSVNPGQISPNLFSNFINPSVTPAQLAPQNIGAANIQAPDITSVGNPLATNVDSEYAQAVRQLLENKASRDIADLRARFGASGGVSRGTPAAFAESMYRAEALPQIAAAMGDLRQKESAIDQANRALKQEGILRGADIANTANLQARGQDVDIYKSLNDAILQNQGQTLSAELSQRDILNNLLINSRGQDIQALLASVTNSLGQREQDINAAVANRGLDNDFLNTALQNTNILGNLSLGERGQNLSNILTTAQQNLDRLGQLNQRDISGQQAGVQNLANLLQAITSNNSINQQGILSTNQLNLDRTLGFGSLQNQNAQTGLSLREQDLRNFQGAQGNTLQQLQAAVEAAKAQGQINLGQNELTSDNFFKSAGLNSQNVQALANYLSTISGQNVAARGQSLDAVSALNNARNVEMDSYRSFLNTQRGQDLNARQADNANIMQNRALTLQDINQQLDFIKSMRGLDMQRGMFDTQTENAQRTRYAEIMSQLLNDYGQRQVAAQTNLLNNFFGFAGTGVAGSAGVNISPVPYQSTGILGQLGQVAQTLGPLLAALA